MPVGDLSKAGGQPQFSDDLGDDPDGDLDGYDGGWGESPEHDAAPQDPEAASPFETTPAAVPPAVGGNVELPGPQATG